MYHYNNERNFPCDTDYMLISPNVPVFRDAKLNLLDDPYKTAVVTIDAPDRKRSAADVSNRERRRRG